MDWLDEVVEKIKNRRQTLQWSLVLYIVAGILLVIAGSSFVNIFCIGWERFLLEEKNVLTPIQFYLWHEPATITTSLTSTVFFLQSLRISSWVILSIVAVFMVAKLFYHRKIQQPVLILQIGIDAIKKDDLRKQIFYQSGDEFEDIAQGFEEMRCHLIESHRHILQLHDEQRKINAAFSHDLRTPLAVIQNNAELIDTFYATGEMSEEILQKSMKKIKNNVQRLTSFSKTMQEIQKVDEINLVKEYQFLEKIISALKMTADSLAPKKVSLIIDESFTGKASYDLQIITEVAENLLNNACRFSKKKVQVTLQKQQHFLYLFVQDDGPGFTKTALNKATGAYYSSDKKNHFGLGLTISEAMVHKHGGIIRLSNSINGGAIVTAIFAC